MKNGAFMQPQPSGAAPGAGSGVTERSSFQIFVIIAGNIKRAIHRKTAVSLDKTAGPIEFAAHRHITVSFNDSVGKTQVIDWVIDLEIERSAADVGLATDRVGAGKIYRTGAEFHIAAGIDHRAGLKIVDRPGAA